VTVLLVPVRYPPNIGGIETLLEHTMPTLRELGREFVVVTGTDGDHETSGIIDGIPVYRLPFQSTMASPTPGRLLAMGSRLREIERDHDIALRHVHGLDCNLWFVARRHRQQPLPLLVSVHGTLDPPHPFSRVTRDALLAADLVTAVSDSVRASIETTIPELDGTVRVIPNGVTVNLQGAAPPAVPGRVFMAGRLDWLKGFDLVVRALAGLRSSHPEVHVRIAGEGHEWQRLLDIASAEGVADHVELLGPCAHTEVIAEIARAAVVVVPSRAIEGFSLVALEAAHLGRPVLATNVGGLTETVVDGVTGVLVPPEDLATLTGALTALLDAPQHAETLGRAAREHARRYDAEHCARAYASTYDQITDASGLLVASPTGTS